MKKTTKLTKKPVAKPIRHATRFKPDPLTIAQLSVKSDFTAQIAALVLNESFTGCALLITTDETFKKDQKVHVKVGHLNAMAASIIWIIQIDESIFKVGLKYLE